MLMFTILYAGSCLPWAFSFFNKDRTDQQAYFFTDLALTGSACYFLFLAHGVIGILILALLNTLLGESLKLGFGLVGYTNISDDRAIKAYDNNWR